MSTNVPFNANPLASNSDTPIPFDITRPAFTKTIVVAANSQLVVTMPSDVNLAMIVSDEAFVVVDRPGSVVNSGGWTIGGFDAGPEIYYNFILGSEVVFVAKDAPATIVINCQTIWSALQNIGKYAQS